MRTRLPIYRFVSHKIPCLYTLRRSTPLLLLRKLHRGQPLTRAEKNRLPCGSGITQLMGWEFNFRPHLSRFLVRIRYYGWLEHRAIDRTALRAHLGSYSILEIVGPLPE